MFPRKFSCFLIGLESFTIPCAELLLAKNWQILGIFSTGDAIEQWADSHQIRHICPTVDIRDFLSQQPFDYLFSIANDLILSPEIIGLPLRGAINCHDALLPKYGGINAPAWAILNREKVHGITWHQITDLIDGGDLLKQVPISIDADETAFSLNSKCYQAIVDSFDRLIGEIVAGEISPISQNLTDRSYFSRNRKPTPGCILDWNWDAEKIDATIRALAFGRYQNSIGLPKFAISAAGQDLVIVTKVAVTPKISGSQPGTIIEMSTDRLTVATNSYDLQLLQVGEIDGAQLSIAELVAKFQLQIGDRLPDLDRSVIAKIDRIEPKLVKHEDFWVKRLATLLPIEIPYATAVTLATRRRCEGAEDKVACGCNSSERGGYATLEENRNCQEWLLPASLLDSIADRSMTLPPDKFLFAAIAVFLARISQQTCFDLVWKSGELNDLLTGLPDLFASEVPCRIEIDPAQSFRENYLAIVRQLTETHQHQTYALDISSRYPVPIGQSSLSINDRLPIWIEFTTSSEGDRLELPVPKLRHRTSGLTFVISTSAGKFWCDYDPNFLTENAITELLEQLNNSIERILIEPDRSIFSLPLLTDRELHRVLVEWNDTQAEYPHDKCIHQLFAAQVELTPEAIAVSHDRQQLTYRELNNRSNRLAHYLRTLGVAPDVLVGICAERSIATIVGILGILKAGGAYVPLDPAYPQERLAGIIADAAISVLLTDSRSIEKLPVHQAQVVWIDCDLPTSGDLAAERNCQTEVEPHHLAYVIYTSGSTGTPKGVEIEHRSLVNYTIAAKREYQIDNRDRILQFTSIGFDVSAEEIYTCLTAGATLVLRTDEMLASIETFLNQCREWQISVVSLPTAYWHELTARMEPDRLLLPPSLRLVAIGGEQVAAVRLGEWQRAVGTRVRLINAYGPTEATISSLWCDLSALTIDPNVPEIPIGRPIANTQVYVLDRSGSPCPIGIIGELYLGGIGLARGYLNRPELTAQRFIPNPFRPGERLYATGDLGKYLPDGELVFCGRSDNQVKIRGFRVELGEIEHVLNAHPGIQEALVMDRVDAIGQKSLTAYVVPKRRSQQMEWWPSVGEYPLYDELLYHSMTSDEPRNQVYRAAIERLVPNRVVVEIGTGKDALLARFCIEAGAKKVYAIESSEKAYQQAKATISRLGLQDRIVPIYGYSTEIELPELVDICVSEIIGTIGGSEGVAPILNDARRFLKPQGQMIPHRSITKIAAVTLPSELRSHPGFQEVPGHYVRKIFDYVGQSFDVRLCVKNFPLTSIISSDGVFEDLAFTAITPIESSQEIDLIIDRSARLDGLLLWLNLQVAPDLTIDNLAREYSWLPVYLPIFYPSINVIAGDRIVATCWSRMSDNQINPDYRIEGRLVRTNDEVLTFAYDSLHHQSQVRSQFYELLFPAGKMRSIADLANLSDRNLRAYLTRNLPDYMVPSSFVKIEAFPLTPNGKIDRAAITASTCSIPSSGNNFVAPRNAIQTVLTQIWSRILQIEKIGIYDNFFDLGGHSLSAMRIFAEIERELGHAFPLAILLQQQTIADLAEAIARDRAMPTVPTSRSFEWSLPNLTTRSDIQRVKREWQSLVTIERGQPHKTPFFWIHVTSDNILLYRQLASRISSDRPFYGLQPRGLDGKQVPIDSVPELAAAYINEIRMVQPIGPYCLGGYSFSGTISLEVARQLRNLGQEIELLAILDSDAPVLNDLGDRPVVPSPTGFNWYLGAIEKLLWRSNRQDRIKKYLLSKVEEHTTLGKLRIPYRWYVSYIKRSLLEIGRLDVAWADYQAYLNYVPSQSMVPRPVYPGKVDLFCSDENKLLLQHDWMQIATGGVEIHSVPGTSHRKMIEEPYLGLLVAQLSDVVRKSQ